MQHVSQSRDVIDRVMFGYRQDTRSVEPLKDIKDAHSPVEMCVVLRFFMYPNLRFHTCVTMIRFI